MSSLSDIELKKEAIRLVLTSVQVSEGSHEDEDFDFLGGGGTSPVKLTHEKTLEFLRRSNLYNNQEFDPDYILQV